MHAAKKIRLEFDKWRWIEWWAVQTEWTFTRKLLWSTEPYTPCILSLKRWRASPTREIGFLKCDGQFLSFEISPKQMTPFETLARVFFPVMVFEISKTMHNPKPDWVLVWNGAQRLADSREGQYVQEKQRQECGAFWNVSKIREWLSPIRQCGISWKSILQQAGHWQQKPFRFMRCCDLKSWNRIKEDIYTHMKNYWTVRSGGVVNNFSKYDCLICE